MSKIILMVVCMAMAGAWIPLQAGEDYDPNAHLRALLARSDLVIVATPQTVCGGCFSMGPTLDGTGAAGPRYDSFLPELKIDQVIKGNVARDKILTIDYTIMVLTDPNLRFVDPGKGKSITLDLSKLPKESPPMPGSPLKGCPIFSFWKTVNFGNLIPTMEGPERRSSTGISITGSAWSLPPMR